MDTIDILQRTIDYIEENLKSEISADELAKLSGFSTYHFYHIFGTYNRNILLWIWENKDKCFSELQNI
ncbi:hypothetical protein KQI88_03510 [Alkaliphilus sp. MSJ-5]|uniref:HTH araC/xylS-type domain-containing protein n=1 Tax=Alkaliphilus flagellatus TaxID=2841507 RepID=A0ABS6G283_9FIRM|nr:hypothetical protein [Alkaliphilus flagellatus]MBU5675481.1 hypothetical protein [Alkaliphilus flagellatus]